MDNNPYRVVFQSLPFDEAIEFSIKYARNKLKKELNIRIEVYKFLNNVDDGFIPFDTTTYKDDFTISMGYALHALYGIPADGKGVVSMVQS